jgi:hypothetical protein
MATAPESVRSRRRRRSAPAAVSSAAWERRSGGVESTNQASRLATRPIPSSGQTGHALGAPVRAQIESQG